MDGLIFKIKSMCQHQAGYKSNTNHVLYNSGRYHCFVFTYQKYDLKVTQQNVLSFCHNFYLQKLM